MEFLKYISIGEEEIAQYLVLDSHCTFIAKPGNSEHLSMEYIYHPFRRGRSTLGRKVNILISKNID